MINNDNGSMATGSTFEQSAEAKRLAQEHWGYIESILLKELDMMGKMYRDGMMHGYKHGYVDAMNKKDGK